MKGKRHTTEQKIHDKSWEPKALFAWIPVRHTYLSIQLK